MEAVICFLVLTLVQIGSCNPFRPPFPMQKPMMPYYGGMHHESFPVKGKSAVSDSACVTETCSVTLHVVDRDGECVTDAMVYYTTTSSGLGLCRTDSDGYVTFNVKGCETRITVLKEGLQVASKTIDLSKARQSSCFIEMKPKCNYWLFVVEAEGNTCLEHADVVYGHNGLAGVATTNSHGHVCINVDDGDSVRAIASTSETLVGVFEQKVKLSLSNWALINVPAHFEDKEVLKVTLAWANGDHEEPINLALKVLQFSNKNDDFCCLVPDEDCDPLIHYGDSTNGMEGGEMVVWGKTGKKSLYLIFVQFYDDCFYDSQARVVLYSSDGKTKLINADKRGSSAGYWLVGCVKDGDFSTFKKINEISSDEPQADTCSKYL